MTRQPKMSPHGLMFHRFHRAGERPSGQGSVSDIELERLIDSQSRDLLLSPDEWLAALAQDTLKPGEFCLTFDDGLASQSEIALPILERRGIKAFWFVFSSVLEGGIDRNEVYNFFAGRYFDSFDDFVEHFLGVADPDPEILRSPHYESYRREMTEKFSFYSENDIRYRFLRNWGLGSEKFHAAMEKCISTADSSIQEIAASLWMSPEQVRALCDKGHAIGLHSYSHPLAFKELPIDDQRQEYQLNFDHLNDLTRRRPVSASHPLGSYDAATLTILQDLGIRCAFCSSMTIDAGLAGRHAPELQVPRRDAVDAIREQQSNPQSERPQC